MTEKTYQVGDVVAWDKVPNGAVVRWRWNGHGNELYWKRHNFGASLVGTHDGKWYRPGNDDGSFAPDEPVTIIALDVPADATAEHLRTLAEVFEVRENLLTLARWPNAPLSDDIYETIGQMAARREDWQTWLAERLHRAGWRPGMTAEDAARLLAEQETACRR